ncbi:HNH endonuclease [Macrococcus capreoli]|uniref:HNH endonuclease n=1 Tax=Macrococcus capreoli TaxID=2982690 RepID=UPI003EE4F876
MSDMLVSFLFGGETMPSKSDSVCAYPGCSRTTSNRYCELHIDTTKQKHKEYDRERTDQQEVSFYNSKQWKDVRATVLQRDFYLCQQCKRQGITTFGNIVHHIVELKDDWSLRLDMNNLETVCSACHNQEHTKTKKGLNTSTKNQVIVVVGLPGSGKSTFVDINCDRDKDIVIDMDELIVTMTNKPLHDRTLNAYDAVDMANDMIRALIDNLTLLKYKFRRIWLIRSSLSTSESNKLKSINCRFVHILRQRNLCEHTVSVAGRTIPSNVFTQIEDNINKMKQILKVEEYKGYDKMKF